jgi:hypothetical protein
MSQVQFPGTLSADFEVDQVTDPNGAPANVLDLDQGFAVIGHLVFPNWLAGTGNVSIYADQRGGGYDQKILSTDITIVASGPEPALTRYDWTATYPTDLPSSSVGLTDPSPDPGSQVYRLTAVFTYNGAVGDVGAFVDMGPYMIN